MARKVDLRRLKSQASIAIDESIDRYDHLEPSTDFLLRRWIAMMTAVEIHALWERYAEERLVAALNHETRHFVETNDIKGVSRISSGLAKYVVRDGSRFFDFRSSSELLDKADRLVGKTHNPFRTLPVADRNYLDALLAIRNYAVHNSDASRSRYKRMLNSVYGISSVPKPGEFLAAIDHRASSPGRYGSRLHGLGIVVKRSLV